MPLGASIQAYELSSTVQKAHSITGPQPTQENSFLNNPKTKKRILNADCLLYVYVKQCYTVHDAVVLTKGVL